MPLKLKLGDNKRTKSSQPGSPQASKPTPIRSDHKNSTSKSPRHHSSTGDSVPSTPTEDDDVFHGGKLPLRSPQSAPEFCDPSPLTTVKHEQRRRPKSVSEPPEPESVRSKDSSKPGRNRAFSVSRSGKFKESKRRTSLLEIQDRFDKAAKDNEGESNDGKS